MSDLFIGLLAGLLVIMLLMLKELFQLRTISPREFIQRLRKSAKSRDIHISQLDEMLNRKPLPVLIDLRKPEIFKRGYIPGALSIPFDDFMHEVLVNEKYGKDDELILICDHGLKSKVAVDILGEDEGFSSVFSVRGGMEAWNKQMHSGVCCARLRRCCA